MRRKKPVQSPAPSVIEYFPAGENTPWKVEKFKELQGDIGVSEAELPAFHGLAASMGVAFHVARLIYGINPVIPALDSNPDMLRVFTRSEAAEKLGLGEASQIDGQLELLTFAWASAQNDKRLVGLSAKREPPLAPPAMPAEVTEEHLNLMAQHGFALSIFDVSGRNEDQRQGEIRWFAGRLIELRKMFDEPMAKSLARQALLNEMNMRRCDDQMMNTPITSDKFAYLQSTKEKIEETYQRQWAQLEEICPFIKGVVGKQTFAGVMSDIVEAYKKFKADEDNQLVDGIFTAFEIAIEMRHSTQANVRYRPGLVAAINEAKQGLCDRNWRRKLPNSVIAGMDAGFKAAFHQAIEESGIPVVDLEKSGPAGEYPDLVEAATLDEPIAPPAENVNLE